MSTHVEKFHQDHGDYIQHNGWLLFEDGAARENASYGLMRQPPTDPFECAKRIRYYWQLKLEKAERAFTNRKTMLQESARMALKQGGKAGPSLTPEQAKEELEELKAEVKQCRAKLEEATELADRNTPAAVRKREEMVRQNRERQAELLRTVENIEI